MFTPKTHYAKIAYDTILFFVSTGQVRKMSDDKISADLQLKVACIVSVLDTNDKLIGYFGNVIPQTDSFYNEIIENAIGAIKSEKFASIQTDQLSKIKVYVDGLSALHKVENVDELKPTKHGLYIKTKSGKSGFILPNRNGVKTVEQQIEVIKKEHGIREKDHSKLELWYFKSTRYD